MHLRQMSGSIAKLHPRPSPRLPAINDHSYCHSQVPAGGQELAVVDLSRSVCVQSQESLLSHLLGRLYTPKASACHKPSPGVLSFGVIRLIRTTYFINSCRRLPFAPHAIANPGPPGPGGGAGGPSGGNHLQAWGLEGFRGCGFQLAGPGFGCRAL